MIGILIGHLAEDRADPHGGHAQALQVADLAGQALEGAPHPMSACLPPGGGLRLGLDGIAGIARLEKRGAPAGDLLAVITA